MMSDAASLPGYSSESFNESRSVQVTPAAGAGGVRLSISTREVFLHCDKVSNWKLGKILAFAPRPFNESGIFSSGRFVFSLEEQVPDTRHTAEI